jgi:hypothetical protein
MQPRLGSAHFPWRDKFLGEIKRLVGLRQQVHHVERGLLAIGQTDTNGRADWAAIDFLGGVGESLANALGYRHRLITACVIQHDGKLLAAKATKQVGRTDRLARRITEDFQYAIAQRVTEAVIDRLELIEVDEQHGGWPRITAMVLGELGDVLQK